MHRASLVGLYRTSTNVNALPVLFYRPFFPVRVCFAMSILDKVRILNTTLA
jgi:hypothetical protein